VRSALGQAKREVTSFTSSAKSEFGSLGSSIKGVLAGAVGVFSVGALISGFKEAFAATDQFEASQRKLAATAAINGQSLAFLQGIAGQAKTEFQLSATTANEFAIELSKLTAKAGDVNQSGAALKAFLDIGAARGLDATQTLDAVRQAILGIDEGTDKLFGANPSVLYQKYAESIGTTVGKLTDQQKAQAIVNAALEDGAKIAGQYHRALDTAAGRSSLFKQSIEELKVEVGQAFTPLRELGLMVGTFLVRQFTAFIGGIQMLGADLAAFFLSIPARVQLAVGLALDKIGQMIDAVRGLLSRFGIDVGEGLSNSVRDRAFDMIRSANTQIRNLREAADEVKEEIAIDVNVKVDVGGKTEASSGASGEAAPSTSVSTDVSPKPKVVSIGGIRFRLPKAPRPVHERNAGDPRDASVLDPFGGPAGIAADILGAASSDGGGGLNMLLRAGEAFASGGSVGLASFGLNFVGSALGKIFGSSREREEEQYRAHARALREARDTTPIVHLHFPKGALYDTSSPDFQEAIMETIELATGNRVGRVQVSVG